MTPSQITLLIYLVILLPLMLLGFYFARRKMFNQHKLTMTTIFIANWVLIAWVMSPSYRAMVSAEPAPDYSTIPVILPTIHMALGAIAQLMATYLVILMWTERTPLEKFVPFRIKNIKTPMRITLSLWIITILLGVGIYSVWYGFDEFLSNTPEATLEAPSPEDTETAPEPDGTEEASGEESEVEEPSTTEEP